MRLVDRRVPLVEFKLIQPRFKGFHRNITVLVLGFFRARDNDPGRLVGDPHRRVGGVDVLPARTGRAIGINPNIRRVYLDLDIVIHHRIDPDRAKRCVPLGRRVIGRNPHKTMHAAFGFEPPIGVMAGNLIGGGFDPRLFARCLRLKLDLIALFLGPTHIHPRQHRRPVTAFRAPRARVDLKERVVAIGLAIKQRLKLFLRRLFRQRLKRGLGIGNDFGVLFHLAKLDKLDIVAQVGLDTVDRVESIHKGLTLPHELLRRLRVVPEVRVFHPRIELLKPVLRRLPVHTLAQQFERLFDVRNNGLSFGAHENIRFLFFVSHPPDKPAP